MFYIFAKHKINTDLIFLMFENPYTDVYAWKKLIESRSK